MKFEIINNFLLRCKSLKRNDNTKNFFAFMFFILIFFLFYYGSLSNYFFSDDFDWLSRSILVNDSILEIIKIKGRDFNPLTIIVFWSVLKVFGFSAIAFRVLSMLSFILSVFAFYYILKNIFKIDNYIAFYVALLFGVNVYISETMLYLATFVYPISLFFFLLSLKYYFKKKYKLYILFLIVAFLFKETIILATVPLFFYEKKNKPKLFVFLTSTFIFIIRAVLQIGTASKYTSFVSTKYFFYKLYFIMFKAINLSPYNINLIIGIGILIGLFIVLFSLLKKNRGILFFISVFIIYVVFFALVPKLSSKYIYYASFGFFGALAYLLEYMYLKYKMTKSILFILFIFVLSINYLNIQKEIEDYKILGAYSKKVLRQHRKIIQSRINPNSTKTNIRFYKANLRALSVVYKTINNRGNLRKLLPYRKNSINGVISFENLIPIVFFPQHIARWKEKLTKNNKQKLKKTYIEGIIIFTK